MVSQIHRSPPLPQDVETEQVASDFGISSDKEEAADCKGTVQGRECPKHKRARFECVLIKVSAKHFIDADKASRGARHGIVAGRQRVTILISIPWGRRWKAQMSDDSKTIL